MKIVVFWDVTPCSLLDRFEHHTASAFRVQDEGSMVQLIRYFFTRPYAVTTHCHMSLKAHDSVPQIIICLCCYSPFRLYDVLHRYKRHCEELQLQS